MKNQPSIGTQIKNAASLLQVLGFIGIVSGAVCLFLGIIREETSMILTGVYFLLGCYVEILLTATITGFGQLVDDVHELKNSVVNGRYVDDSELPDL